jgi:hypothetical protein
MVPSRRRTRTSTTFLVIAALIQWIFMSIALGAMIIYTDRSLEGLLGFHLDSGYAFLGGSIVGFLMGATIDRTKLLILMVVSSCAAGAGIYVALLFYPVWTGTLVQTVGLENFASTRALLYFGISLVPVSLGALIGRLSAVVIPGGDLLRRSERDNSQAWWLDRTPRGDAPSKAE